MSAAGDKAFSAALRHLGVDGISDASPEQLAEMRKVGQELAAMAEAGSETPRRGLDRRALEELERRHRIEFLQIRREIRDADQQSGAGQ